MLAIGIVVDDAIVVVENVERYLREGLSPKEAAHKTMDEVGVALIAIALVLARSSCRRPSFPALQGAFYRQFAITIAVSTALSAVVSLTLSPALAAILLKPHADDRHRGRCTRSGTPFRAFFRGFNGLFDALSIGYGALTRGWSASRCC